MILFFGDASKSVIAVDSTNKLAADSLEKLIWLFGGLKTISNNAVAGNFIGPRAAMLTPWSTNAVEMTQNMGIQGIRRMELYHNSDHSELEFDPMVAQRYKGLDQQLFLIDITPEPVKQISDIAGFNQEDGLALNIDEISYLEQLSKKLDRPLTDSEVFGFSQVNSEHCRHKIFNGKFIIDGEEMPSSLFQLIKRTSKENHNEIVSAYKDNVAFVNGPEVVQFAPRLPNAPSNYERTKFESVISLKAETHNFPTTVEPFSGAATGSGGEIRDRLAGGKGAIPLAGTAVYMTPYPRLKNDRPWENSIRVRNWLYQKPEDILIKASNGASDFGNKFGQPLINGSLLTFEHQDGDEIQSFDKVIMLAGGIGYSKKEQAQKAIPNEGDLVVILGGDNYRIGMGGASVSSTDTGAYGENLELNAVQRSNPEMQKRAANAIRALVEETHNPIVSIHDHGAGGHLNCLSELLEDKGGVIDIDKLPVGDPTLSAKEIIGNESQERMGLIINPADLPLLQEITDRERCPMYVVGLVTGDHRFSFKSEKLESNPIDLALEDFFGNSPKTIMNDQSIQKTYSEVDYSFDKLDQYLNSVLRLESVACKDWLTNKVDRCVGGRVSTQQCCGPLQLPLNNLGVMALDYESPFGVATSLGHAPVPALIDPKAGSRLSITEALTNIIWAPLKNGIKSISLSANWMWPCNNEGEDARLYHAVKEVSDFCIDLGINVPTGKDSMSMKQKYPDREVKAPGTVVITAVGECNNINKVVEPVLKKDGGDLYYVNLSMTPYELGGSAFAQVNNAIGIKAPNVLSAHSLAYAFDIIQGLISKGKISAGHDISAGGMISCLLEMCFSSVDLGMDIDLNTINEKDIVKLLFAENPGLIIQSREEHLLEYFVRNHVEAYKIGSPVSGQNLRINKGDFNKEFHIPDLRDVWYESSYLLDEMQTANGLAKDRFNNYKKQPLSFKFHDTFSGTLPSLSDLTARPQAAVLREQGSNSERELANALYLAGFEVRDVHMTDLISGKETLEDIQFLGAVGGFANSDVLGSAKGWAGAILYNEKAKAAFDHFFSREDVLSIGICNGCQLFMELDLINPKHTVRSKMDFNDSHKHESNFTSVRIQENNSILLSSMAGSTLGIWVSHGEGKFILPKDEKDYNIVAKWGYEGYPANPNGSDYNTAMLCSKDGRHLATMPHLERSIFPWNWAYYEQGREDQVSPWLDAFINARKWIESI